jgi:hypothetical protein
MNALEIRAKVLSEIAALPDEKLSAIYELLTAFRSASAHARPEFRDKNRRVALAKKLYGAAHLGDKHVPNDAEVAKILEEAREERFGVAQ